ncbi:MAG: hypothetical protein KGJ62_10010 [Armatimonadetes bacterium]|nr:hypothetical protein [Armatimonadota bacterium]MDE2206683.1 hypothetical protein [Armatimonadota bacterium]
MRKKPLGPPPDWINPEPGDGEGSGDPLRSIFSEARTVRSADDPQSDDGPLKVVLHLAAERAEAVRDAMLLAETRKRLLLSSRDTGCFSAIHVAPAFTADVPDTLATSLVILSPHHPHETPDAASDPALHISDSFLNFRGSGPRRYRNTLVFLAPDSRKVKSLYESIRALLAWRSIAHEGAALSLDAIQLAHARAQADDADAVVNRQIGEAWKWLLVPTQADPAAPIQWRELALEAGDGIASRCSARLCAEDLLLLELPPTVLRDEYDRLTGWLGSPVPIAQLPGCFATYLYLPRLQSSRTLNDAIPHGLAGRTEALPNLADIDARGPVQFHAVWDGTAAAFIRDFGRIRSEVLQHLGAAPGAAVRVRLHVNARFREGASPGLVKSVGERCRSLGFVMAEFEKENPAT